MCNRDSLTLIKNNCSHHVLSYNGVSGRAEETSVYVPSSGSCKTINNDIAINVASRTIRQVSTGKPDLINTVPLNSKGICWQVSNYHIVIVLIDGVECY